MDSARPRSEVKWLHVYFSGTPQIFHQAARNGISLSCNSDNNSVTSSSGTTSPPS